MNRSLASLPLLALVAACGGGGPQTISGQGPVVAPGGTDPHTFVAPTVTKSYNSPAALQSLSYDLIDVYHYDKKDDPNSTTVPPTRIRDDTTRELIGEGQGATLYTSNVSTVRAPGVTVTYDPKNAQFTLQVQQNGVNQNLTFQDPAHRTDFDGNRAPQAGVPNLELNGGAAWREKGAQYLEVYIGDRDNSDVATFFYELPGTTTKYVTWAGYVRNRFEKASTEEILSENDNEQFTQVSSRTVLERGAFVFGEQTATSAVPTSGSARYTGGMIGSMIFNPTLDDPDPQDSYFQWMSGQATLDVNFSSGTFTSNLTGVTDAPHLVRGPILTPATVSTSFDGAVLPQGASFTASGSGRIDLAGTGGFTGAFSNAGFTWAGNSAAVDIAGGTIEGAFYGPKAEEVGAAFRIVGGVPDQRIDIMGSFTGRSGN